MSSGQESPSAGLHDLLHDLVPQGAAQEASFAEVASALGVSAAADLLVHRSTVPVSTTQFAASLPAWAAGLQAERVIGPITDRLGIDTWFRIFRRVRHVRFVRSAGAPPFLALPIVQLTRVRAGSPAPTSVEIGPGSLWFATHLIAAAAGTGVYTGLRIRGGTLRFGQPVNLSGDEVVVPPGVVCDLTLNLDPPAAPGGTGPGQDVRDSAFKPPRKVTLHVAGASATLTVRDAPSLRVYAQDVAFDHAPGAATYLPQFNRVSVPLTPRIDHFAVGTVRSDGFRPEGSAPIAGAGWALPAAVIAPADLGDASGVGALMLVLAPGLSAAWTGQTDAVPLGPTAIFLDEARLATASGAVQGFAAQSPELPATLGRGRLELSWGTTFPIVFIAQAAGSEAVFTTASVHVSLEKPVDVSGERVTVTAPNALLVFIETTAGRFILAQADVHPPSLWPGLGFALTNAVLRASLPGGFTLIAAYDGVAAGNGVLAIGYELFGIIPSLPDPYAANAAGGINRQSGGRLISLARWTPAQATVDFSLPQQTRLPTALLDSTASSATAMQTRPVRDNQPAFFAAATSKGFDPGSETGPAARALGDTFNFELLPRLVLLDVSSNVSQFGVALRPPHGERIFATSVAGQPNPLAIDGLDLVADGRLLVLLTLPAVQWEPVEAEPVPDDPAFPSRLTFANSGVPTVIDVPTVNLVPVTPEAALGSITTNFAGPNPRAAHARFTLPFGMIGNALLGKPGPSRGAHVSEFRPASADGLRGGRQLRIDAVDPSLAAGETPALPGFAVQLPVAIPADGSPGPRSILGTDVTNIFNGYLGNGSPNALVPVTRIDLSGYGESLFSAWANPTDDETQVSKAEFDVLVGRTAFEVVQVRSILLPYRVPVVRTITLERKNNAVITRHDSGWVAVGDGAYRFGVASGIVTHPGVVRRITNVTHIRDTDQRVTEGGIEFVGAYYQGDLILDGAARPVPVAQHFGFVKIGTPPLTPAVYAALLADQGPLCGPLDTTIAVGGGAQKMRLHRVGAGVTQSVSGPEFVMTAWGGLVFPGGGDWSVLRADDASGAPQPVAAGDGLPLIRAGAAEGPPPTAPYRFADPVDLAHESTPQHDYGILHATGTQRAFFRRPKIDAADLARIVSTERPVIADPYVLATALGPFPRQSDAIPFPAGPWALAVSGGGQFRLETPAPSFPAGIGRRTIRAAGSVTSDLDYSSSVVTYEVDTAAPVAWHFALTHAKKIVGNTAMGDVVTVSVDVAAHAGRETVFEQPKLRLGGALSIVQDLLTILEDLGITGVFRTSMTNKWSLKAAVTVPFVDALGEDLQIPPLDPLPTVKFSDTGVKVEFDVAPMADSVTFEFGGSPMFAIKSVPGLYVVVILKFTIKLSTADGTSYTLLIGIGLAYSIGSKPWELLGLIAITFFAIFGDNLFGYGVGFLVKVSLSCNPIFSISLSLEGRLARIVVHLSLPDETVFCAAKLTFAVEVSVFLVFSISFELEATDAHVISGPLPLTALPDVL